MSLLMSCSNHQKIEVLDTFCLTYVYQDFMDNVEVAQYLVKEAPALAGAIAKNNRKYREECR